MAVAAHDGRIWLAGGLSLLGEAVSEVEVFDPSSGEWSSGPALPARHPSRRARLGRRAAAPHRRIPRRRLHTPSDLVLTLADGADTWEEGPSLPDARGAGAAAWDGERVVYAGGVGPGGVSGDVFALAGDAWERIGAMPRAREHLAAASDGRGPDLAARRPGRRPGGKPRRRRPRRGHLDHRTRTSPHPSRRGRRLLRSRAAGRASPGGEAPGRGVYAHGRVRRRRTARSAPRPSMNVPAPRPRCGRGRRRRVRAARRGHPRALGALVGRASRPGTARPAPRCS